MPIDKYQPCPCGSGKKIKFCCSADIVAELEKIQRMLDGKQMRAALEHVNHVLERHPDRPSLLSIKALLETELGDTEHAEETVKTFLEASPGSPVALAEQARLYVQEEKPLEAVAALQQAIHGADQQLPGRIYSALRDVAMALLSEGRILAARAHLLLHASLSREDDRRSAEVLMELNSAEQVPMLLRQEWRFANCPDDADYAEKFHEAVALMNRACWQAALTRFEELADKHGRQACIHRNIAILRGFLGRDEDAGRSWRRYAVLVEGESMDDAVEAEAMAQLLDAADASEAIDLLDVTLELEDLDQAMETLLAHKRTPTVPVDLTSLASDNGPAPKAVFWLLDREMPESGKGLTLETSPGALCEVYVFGRETDKPARLELSVSRKRWPQVQEALQAVCGATVAAEPELDVVDKTNVLEDALTWALHFPDDTPRETRMELQNQKRRQVNLDVWPTIAQTALDGKSPHDVQGDPKYRVRLLAAILLLELHGQQNRWQFDYDELRTKLDLPAGSVIDPETVDLNQLSVVRYARLDAARVPTDQLATLFQYAAMMSAPMAVRNLGRELANREVTDDLLNKAAVYEILARMSLDGDEALQWIDKAREAEVAAGGSPARWLLAELSLQIEQGNGDRVQELIQRIQAKHQREPGVMQGLMNLLMRYGLLDPYAAGAPGAGMPAPGVPAAEADEGGIWTPDSPASKPAESPAGGGEEKSGLWLPGMD